MTYQIRTTLNSRLVMAIACVAILFAAGVLIAAEDKSDQAAVLDANQSFYRAFAEKDLAAMKKLWADEKRVAVIHPGWPGLDGRDDVIASWERILNNPTSPDIKVAQAKAYVFEQLAFVVCYEVLETGVLIATNIFVKQDGDWKMAHHHASTTMGLPPTPKGEPI
jgi:ketosteroid isomerase-like protein